jgi:hypothetical protein
MVTGSAVESESGMYVPLKVINPSDPIVVLVRVSVPDATWMSVNPAVIAVAPACCSTDDPTVRLVVDDVIIGVTPFPNDSPNVTRIKSNKRVPSFVIPAPFPPNPLPILTVANDVSFDFTIVFVSVTLDDNSPLVNILISLPVVPLKCPVAFSIVLHLNCAVPQ